MKRARKKYGIIFAPLVLLLLAAAFPAGALEVSQGKIRLALHEHTGRFSLYGMNSGGRFEPFFSDKDPRTSFIELNLDGKIYRLGDTGIFPFHVETAGESPAIIFENEDVQVRQEFTFIATSGSGETNGVQINIRVRNRKTSVLTAGLRFALDTNLGEGNNIIPFFAGSQNIESEILMQGVPGRTWVSRSPALSLMGSAGAEAKTKIAFKNPDYLYFANWNRLNEVSWKPVPRNGRNFDNPPYTFNDSAVCYYFENESLAQYGEINCVILLGAEDPYGFSGVKTSAAPETPDSKEADLKMLEGLLLRMDEYLNGQTQITEEELASMERTITRVKSRYNLP